MRKACFSLFSLVFSCALPASEAVEGQESGQVASFNGDRTRTCAAACEVGFVCDESAKGCVTEPAAPMIRFPLSGYVTTGAPALRFATADSATSSVIEICEDRACTKVVARVTGTDRATLAKPLPRGTYFLRAWGVRREAGHDITGATLASVRVFRSNGRPTPSKAPLAFFADFDADGIGDGPNPFDENPVAARSEEESSAVYAAGSTTEWLAVPDMDGDGRTELVQLQKYGAKAGNVTRSSIDPLTGKTREELVPVTPDYDRLLPLGDFDQDGYFDLAAVKKTAAGARLEVIRGGPGGLTRRQSLDLKIPDGFGTFIAATAPGDLDGDGFPELALGTETSFPPPDFQTVPYLIGSYSAQRIVVLRGGAAQAYRQVLTTFTREGDPYTGLLPVGDLDGDGVMDAMAVSPRSIQIMRGNSLVGAQPAFATVLYGGSALRRETMPTPHLTLEREEPAAYDGTTLLNGNDPYASLTGVRTVKDGHVREDYFGYASVVGGNDFDGDGFADITFVSGGGSVRVGPNDVVSDPSMLHDQNRAARGGACVHYGTAKGLTKTVAQRIYSPTVLKTPSYAAWVAFPARSVPQWDGIYLGEDVINEHAHPPINDYSVFRGVYSWSGDKLAPRK